MELGAFSVSLAVKDILASKAFYAALGFTEVGGNLDQNWLILRNRSHTIGLFHGMFDSNILTFNPGWDETNSPLAEFTDVRDIQTQIEKAVVLHSKADPTTAGAASCVLIGPGGKKVPADG
jgi:lactoylglutathione lyase